MIKKMNVKDPLEAAAIVDLQHKSYQVEAELIGFDGIPPLHDTVESIQASDETFLGFYKENRLAGLLAYKVSNRLLDIHRVAVHPDFFRRGIARELLCYLFESCADADRAVVSTGLCNTPAVRLYQKLGFQIVGVKEVGTGIQIVELTKALS